MTQANRSTAELDASLALARIVADLHGQGRLRVWSIIVSALGDLALPRTSALPASALQELMDVLGVEPGAVRTAISRLAKEGWVTRDRSGRNISYRVADAAVPEFQMASRLIYGASRPVPEGTVSLLIGPEVHELAESPALITLRRDAVLAIGPWSRPLPDTTLVLKVEIGALPGWAQDLLAPPTLGARFRALQDSFAPLATAIETGEAPAPNEAAAARVALVHAWRRVVLRHPRVPNRLLPDDWPEAACRQFVHDLHQSLSGLARPWLANVLPETR